MISLRRYLDAARSSKSAPETDGVPLAPMLLNAYRSSLAEIGNCSLDVCPGLGRELKKGLDKLGNTLTPESPSETIEATEESVRKQLQDWSGRAATHYRDKAAEVKDILLLMAHTAESVGLRDERCARQIDEVTTRLKSISNLDDLTQIRASIERSASELKTSVSRMAAEGKAAIERLRTEVAAFQTKLDEAEHIAACDSLTGLRNRLSVERQIETRMSSSIPFCVAILDIDGFKQVNDDYGHMIGDELLELFSQELKARSRARDVVGRWGGDEFIILLDCDLRTAKGQTERIRDWVCGNYTVHAKSGPLKLKINVSLGVAEYFKGETMKSLLSRADAEMYQCKAASYANANRPQQ
jgi:diguanylate cyclase (GGDEF)-like protein